MSDDQKKSVERNARMREEWNARVQHDYRYWMSDGVESDELMWQSGVRDFSLLTQGLTPWVISGWTALEIGCGVGRLLKPAASSFARVIGVDVSDKALERAKELCQAHENIEYVLSSGEGIPSIPDNSVDFVFSFAALSNVPVRVLASYLDEANRVLREGGVCRLQLYVGEPKVATPEDTIAIRSYSLEALSQAFESAGFSLPKLIPLALPFNTADEAETSKAYLLECTKRKRISLPQASLISLLSPEREQSTSEWSGSLTHHLMALARVQQLMDSERPKEALVALDFALSTYADYDPELETLHKRLSALVEKKPARASINKPLPNPERVSLRTRFSQSMFDRNLQALRYSEPDLVARLEAESLPEDLFVSETEDGPVLWQGTTALDHGMKPARAAEKWARQLLENVKVKSGAPLMLGGFAGGYHLQALVRESANEIHVIEPNLPLLKAAFGLRDLSAILERLSSLSTTKDWYQHIVERLSGDAYYSAHPQSKLLFGDTLESFRNKLWKHSGVKSLKPAIAVIGPMYGGSLPIARYTYRALAELGHRVTYYDMSPFHDGYDALFKFGKEKASVSMLHNSYVELMSNAVLNALTERPVDIVLCLAQAPVTGKVLAEIKRRGMVTAMWFVEDYQRFTAWQNLARYFDYMFVIQQGEAIKQIEAAGAGKAVYLPLACDPEIHVPQTLQPEEIARWGSDVSFLGAGYNNRVQMFARLAHHNFKIWGTEWPTKPPFDRLVQEGGRRLLPEEYVKIFNASAINLNLHSSAERDGVEPGGDFVNPRTFELAAAGAFQLTDNRLLLPELFSPGEEIATFNDPHELEDKIRYFLAHPEEREQFVTRARERVLREHTYTKRVETLLETIYEEKFGHLSERLLASPWAKTLQRAKPHSELQQYFANCFERGDDPSIDSIVRDVVCAEGELSDTEMKLLTMYHIKDQVTQFNELQQK